LQATDRFVNTLRLKAGVDVPDIITNDRGRLVDMISDMHQYSTESAWPCLATPINWFP
jgi:nitrogenase molybdenum-iron protein beta chain